jgi:serine protease Do
MPKYWIPLFLALLVAAMFNFAYSQESQPTQEYSSPGAKIYKEVSGSVFAIYGIGKTNEMYGSGVAVKKDLLATNCHVVLRGNSLNYVKVSVNGDMKDGALYYYDTDNDLCLVKVSDAQFSPVNIRPSNELAIGTDVYAIGNPEEQERTISNGVISNKGNVNGKFMLQTNASISHGSSGGGLFDAHGNLIGITTLVASEGENIGFAIPSEVLLADINPNSQSQNHSTPIQQQTSSPNENTQSGTSSIKQTSLTILGYYGDSKIGLIKAGDTCLITIVGRYEKNDKPENESLVVWMPEVPYAFFIIPSTSDINSAMVYILNLLGDKKPDLQKARSILVFDKKLYEIMYDNNLNEKYSVMTARTEGDLTQKLLVDDNFLIQFFQFHGTPGMTTIQFDLDGFTEALAAYNKSCGK